MTYRIPVIETQRFILRQLKWKDALAIHEFMSQEQVARYMTWTAHKSLKETEEFVKMLIAKYESQSLMLWGILYKDTEKVIGTISLSPQGNKPIASMGFTLSQRYWGNGIMTEVVEAVIRFGFEVMNFVRIQGECMIDNQSSARVMEKAGMEFQGVLNQSIKRNGTPHDTKLYAIKG